MTWFTAACALATLVLTLLNIYQKVHDPLKLKHEKLSEVEQQTKDNSDRITAMEKRVKFNSKALDQLAIKVDESERKLTMFRESLYSQNDLNTLLLKSVSALMQFVTNTGPNPDKKSVEKCIEEINETIYGKGGKV